MIDRSFLKMLCKPFSLLNGLAHPTVFSHTKQEKVDIDFFLDNLITMRVNVVSFYFGKNEERHRERSTVKITIDSDNKDSSWTLGAMMVISNHRKNTPIIDSISVSGENGGCITYDINNIELSDISDYTESLINQLIDFLKDA